MLRVATFLILIIAGFFSRGVSHKPLHPYHISASEMEYDTQNNTVEITTKIFTDDLEAVLAKLYHVPANLSKNSAVNDSLIKKYITTHLSIRSNNNLHQLQLFGWEIEQEAVHIYTIADAKSFNRKNIVVENTVLYDLFTDQINIVHFIINGQRKSTRLAFPERRASFIF